MADIRENDVEILHYDDPDFPVFCRYNFIPYYACLSETRLHWHDDLEFIYVTDGSIIQYVNDEKIILKAGDGIFINSRQMHVIENAGVDCKLYCIIMKSTILSSSSYVEKNYVNPVTDNDEIPYLLMNENTDWHRKILDYLKELYELSIDAGNELKMTSRIYDLWTEIYKGVGSPSDEDRKNNSSLTMMKNMLRYIQSEYQNPITLADICKGSGVGRTKCTELFTRYVHMPPIEYLICYRLEKASNLLIESDMNIAEIAYETGFSGSSYFSESFKKRVGCTPNEYRKEYSRNENKRNG